MILIENKKINFNYFLIKIFNAGIILLGWEVKNIKLYNNINISNSIIYLKNKELFLINSYIKNNLGNLNCNFYRKRKLLLNKKEIEIIYNIIYKTNFIIIPKNFFIKNNLIKVTIAIVLKKKKNLKNILK